MGITLAITTGITLAIDTDVLLDRHASEVRLTPMNTGSTIYVPRPRGVGTFSRVEDFDFQARRKRAGRNAVVELAVRDRVHIDEAILESVARFDGGTRIETLYPSPSGRLSTATVVAANGRRNNAGRH